MQFRTTDRDFLGPFTPSTTIVARLVATATYCTRDIVPTSYIHNIPSFINGTTLGDVSAYQYHTAAPANLHGRYTDMADDSNHGDSLDKAHTAHNCPLSNPAGT